MINIPAERDTFVSNIRKGQSQCRPSFLATGKASVGSVFYSRYISYIFFDLSGIPREERIVSADLILHLYDPAFIGALPGAIALGVLGEPFAECTTSFINRPCALAKSLITAPLPTETTMVSMDITKYIKQWHLGQRTNYGLALGAANSPGVALFHSSYSPDSAKHPLLEVSTVSGGCTRPVVNLEETYVVQSTPGFSEAQEVWNYSRYSYIIHNIGTKNILVKLQNSADNILFMDEEPEIELAPGQSYILVSTFFTRYVRIRFRLVPAESGSGTIKIWLQGR
ncbi:DNRLRE domain-containing protein [Desulforamulus ruminis]|uniref:DNRLRE domain-containing protein n=1 Tax=Desulforamulus ruminis TaxID=1564 RepID=UPI003B00A9D0